MKERVESATAERRPAHPADTLPTKVYCSPRIPPETVAERIRECMASPDERHAALKGFYDTARQYQERQGERLNIILDIDSVLCADRLMPPHVTDATGLTVKDALLYLIRESVILDIRNRLHFVFPGVIALLQLICFAPPTPDGQDLFSLAFFSSSIAPRNHAFCKAILCCALGEVIGIHWYERSEIASKDQLILTSKIQEKNYDAYLANFNRYGACYGEYVKDLRRVLPGDADGKLPHAVLFDDQSTYACPIDDQRQNLLRTGADTLYLNPLKVDTFEVDHGNYHILSALGVLTQAIEQSANAGEPVSSALHRIQYTPTHHIKTDRYDKTPEYRFIRRTVPILRELMTLGLNILSGFSEITPLTLTAMLASAEIPANEQELEALDTLAATESIRAYTSQSCYTW